VIIDRGSCLYLFFGDAAATGSDLVFRVFASLALMGVMHIPVALLLAGRTFSAFAFAFAFCRELCMHRGTGCGGVRGHCGAGFHWLGPGRRCGRRTAVRMWVPCLAAVEM